MLANTNNTNIVHRLPLKTPVYFYTRRMTTSRLFLNEAISSCSTYVPFHQRLPLFFNNNGAIRHHCHHDHHHHRRGWRSDPPRPLRKQLRPNPLSSPMKMYTRQCLHRLLKTPASITMFFCLRMVEWGHAAARERMNEKKRCESLARSISSDVETTALTVPCRTWMSCRRPFTARLLVDRRKAGRSKKCGAFMDDS